MSETRLETRLGAEILPVIEGLAALRIEVFRDWPYLYEGDAAYERAYLADYASDGAICVAVWDGARLVGAATAAPMADHAGAFAEALPAGWPLEETLYCAESVLLARYRGRGIGHAFFDAREAHGRALGLKHAVFAAVTRRSDHPLKPRAYRPLDPFWRSRGYAPIDGAVARFAWRDVNESEETQKPLQLWARRI